MTTDLFHLNPEARSLLTDAEWAAYFDHGHSKIHAVKAVVEGRNRSLGIAEAKALVERALDTLR